MVKDRKMQEHYICLKQVSKKWGGCKEQLHLLQRTVGTQAIPYEALKPPLTPVLFWDQSQQFSQLPLAILQQF